MQLCTQQAQRYGDGNGLRNIHTANQRYGNAAQRSSGFVPHNGTAGTCKGQEHRFDNSRAFHSGRYVTHNDTYDQTGKQSVTKEGATPSITDTPRGNPVPQGKQQCLKYRNRHNIPPNNNK